MPVYVIAEVKMIDDAWLPEYAAAVHEIVGRHGGRYLARSARITPLEGDAPDATVVALLEFPHAEAARQFGEDPDYAPYRDARIGGTQSRLYLIDDSDAAGSIPYLPKG